MMKFISAERTFEGYIKITDDHGVIYWTKDNHRYVRDFLSAGGEIKPPPPPDYTFDVKVIRNDLLQRSDWTQLPDAELDPLDVMAWRDYRKRLRSMAINPLTPPDEVRWPEPPGGILW